VGSMLGGLDDEAHVIDLIERRTRTPAITTATAVRTSLARLQVKRIAVATPYTLEINLREKEELEKWGFTVTEIRGCHEDVSPDEFRNEMIGRLLPESAYEMGLKVNSQENEAIFISCTNFRTIEIIEKLEKKTGKPVISSNQATLWHALRRLGLKDSIKGFGRLMEFA